MQDLATNVGLDVGRLTMLFLKSLLGLVPILGVLASTLSLVGSVLTRQVFLEFLDANRRLFLETDGDAAIQHDLASGLDIEVDPGNRKELFWFRLLVFVTGDHQIVVTRSLNKVSIGKFHAMQLVNAMDTQRFLKVLDMDMFAINNSVGIAVLLERNAGYEGLELEPTDLLALF